MLVTLPIGAWTFAFGLDLLALLGFRSKGMERSADLALKGGAVGAAAAAGLADWQHTNGRDRRVGTAHALVNSTSLTLHLASVAHRSRGRLASAAGWTCLLVGGYLGGHMMYRRQMVWTMPIAAQSPATSRPCRLSRS